MRRYLVSCLFVVIASVPLVACAQEQPTAHDAPVVTVEFQSYVTDAACDAKFYVDGVENHEVVLHLNPANGPTEAVWKFAGKDGQDFYNFAWVILENNGLANCLSDTDDIPKNFGGFKISTSGTTRKVTPDTCQKGDYNYLIRAQKHGGGHCGADPKVKIED